MTRPAEFARCATLRFGAALLVGVVLASCMSLPAPVQNRNLCDDLAALTNPAVGGTGGSGGPGGIGGTGAPRAGVDSGGTGGGGKSGGGAGSGGIGGTGIQLAQPVFGDGGIGGTGIVGVITGFASICVNGLEVQYDATTPVWDNGAPASSRQLAVGQVVSLTAAGSGAATTARSISVIHALVGPIGSIGSIGSTGPNAANGTEAKGGQLRVLGQKASALQPADLAGLKAGDWVRVSGHRLADGEVVASRVQPIAVPAGLAAQVRGPLGALSADTFKVGDTVVHRGRAALPPGLRAGQEVWVDGQWDGQVLRARQVVANPTRAGLGRVEQVVLEGYVQQLGGRELSLGLESLQLPDGVETVGGTRAELAVNRRVQITGRVGPDQSITVERVEFSAAPGSGGSGGRGGNSGRGGGGSNSGKGSSGSGSGSSGSGSSGSGSSGSGSSGSGSSGGGSSGGGGGGSGSGK